jgi:hypothetical protein
MSDTSSNAKSVPFEELEDTQNKGIPFEEFEDPDTQYKGIPFEEFEDPDTQYRGIPFEEFEDPQTQLLNDENQNAFDIHCICQTLILRANLGKWVERPKDKV